MNWLKQSITHTRGAARGQVGSTHELSEARQGTFHYTIGPYSQPMLERAAANMRDTIESYMQSLTDADAEVMPYLAGINEEKDAIQQELDYVCAFMARRRAYEDSVMDTVIARLDANDTMKREKTKVYTD